ncbi:hypothetical protein ACFE04_014654 [Oxalis oulophora]
MEDLKLKVVDEFRVGPPPSSRPTTISLPLTLYDLPLLIGTNKYTFKHLFFYAYPHHSLYHFTQTTIPLLKTSLALTLRYFYPYVSNLILPPAPQKPHFLFAEGNSISFIVAQCSGDFDYVTNNHAKEVKLLHSFAPDLPPTHVSSDGTHVGSLLAVQVTLFTDKGICIGTGMSHVVADGRAYHHFVESWALVCRSNGVIEVDKFLMPSFDRNLIEDPNELESKLLKMWHDHNSSSQGRDSLTYDHIYADVVRSEFFMKRNHIEKLKRYIVNNNTHGMANNLSSFVAMCSFVWVCLIKSLETREEDDNYEVCRLGIPVDMRDRITGIPTTYFGNCVPGLFVDVRRSELIAQNGLAVAARAIGNCLEELKTNDASKVAENWVATLSQNSSGSMHLLIVGGSPKFDLYNKDFGWGFPKKVEQLHVRHNISPSKCRDEEGGIRIGIELKRVEMDAFTRLFYQGLRYSLM